MEALKGDDMNRAETFRDILKEVSTILFDVDGTLVDSNDLHAEAWAKALNKNGEAFSAETLRPWIGKGGDKILRELVGIDDEATQGRFISEMRSKLFKADFAPLVKPFPGARDLLLELRRQKFQIVIATSAQRDELKAILKNTQLENTLELFTTSDDANRSKPSPDIIHAALEKAGVEAKDAVLIGDTPYDVEAGLRAGVKVIGVRSGGWSDQSLKGASCVFDDVADILATVEKFRE